MLIALEPEELAQAGQMAEGMFIRQMKRRRGLLDLSQAELAERVVALGGNMYQQTIAKLESGQRALRMSEADVIAAALGTTVQDMLSSNFPSSGAPASRQVASVDELRVELEAVERRLHDATMRTEITADAVMRAQHQAAVAQAEDHRARAEHAHLAQQRDFLLQRLAQATGELEQDANAHGTRLEQLAAELGPDARRRVEEHLRTCKKCQELRKNLNDLGG